MICQERKRQIDVKGWTPEHDDTLNNSEQLSKAAASYLLPEDWRNADTPEMWPWSYRWWKPTPNNRQRELEKGGALTAAAEIDRLKRKERKGK